MVDDDRDYSRRVLEQWLLWELRKAFRNGSALSFLMVDIDDMKGINDTAGHLAGDRALVTLGESLKSATRGGGVSRRDILEFGILGHVASGRAAHP